MTKVIIYILYNIKEAKMIPPYQFIDVCSLFSSTFQDQYNWMIPGLMISTSVSYEPNNIKFNEPINPHKF